jgi:5'-nucleotidase
MIILLDQDGPLADWEAGFLDIWRKRFPHEVAVEVENRTQFETSLDYPKHLRDAVTNTYHAPGFFLNLKPIQGAIEAVKTMHELGHEIFICTAPLSVYEHCVIEKYQWVEKYFGRKLTSKIILTKDKTLVRGDILIDDKPDITGIMKPSWEHVLFEAPYNLNCANGRKRINWSNWREVLEL